VAKEKIPGSKSIVDSVAPLLDKMRGVRPAAAKESAARSAVSTKELVQLSIGYVKQETKQPLVGLLRFVQFGLVSAIFIATGLVLMLLGLLRGLQSGLAYERVNGKGVVERGHFSGSLSFLPYLLTVVGCVIALGLVALLARKSLRSNTAGGNNEQG
jgi:hypothetical protein